MVVLRRTHAKMTQTQNLKPTRTLVPISEQALRKYEIIGRENGIHSIPQLLKQILEGMADTDPANFYAMIVAAKQAGKSNVVDFPKKAK